MWLSIACADKQLFRPILQHLNVTTRDVRPQGLASASRTVFSGLSLCLGPLGFMCSAKAYEDFLIVSVKISSQSQEVIVWTLHCTSSIVFNISFNSIWIQPTTVPKLRQLSKLLRDTAVMRPLFSRVLCVPPSSAPVERVFSYSGLIV